MTTNLKPLSFGDGAKDGAPICFGYVSVAFAFGILAIQKGLPWWCPPLISMTNLSGTGQFVGIDLISVSASFLEIACTILIINLRYLLMSLSLSQKVDEGMGLGKRLLVGFGITDEVFGVSVRKPQPLTMGYMMGLILVAYAGWTGGTILGVFCAGLLPDSLLSALGIAIYAMFVAIIVPAAKESSPVRKVIMMAIVLSCIFYFVPVLNRLSSGWVIIICGVVSSGIGAVFFPVANQPGEEVDAIG